MHVPYCIRNKSIVLYGYLLTNSFLVCGAFLLLSWKKIVGSLNYLYINVIRSELDIYVVSGNLSFCEEKERKKTTLHTYEGVRDFREATQGFRFYLKKNPPPRESSAVKHAGVMFGNQNDDWYILRRVQIQESGKTT